MVESNLRVRAVSMFRWTMARAAVITRLDAARRLETSMACAAATIVMRSSPIATMTSTRENAAAPWRMFRRFKPDPREAMLPGFELLEVAFAGSCVRDRAIRMGWEETLIGDWRIGYGGET